MTANDSMSDLLRFSVIGNVDDGKSTLIGRLLHDTKNILDDQLVSIENASRRRGENYLNLSLLTDGLRSEREQGITIDVAYKYFATENRKFIVADCPGHFQYTRNMVTGTSSANASIIIVDATIGLSEQTKRHAFLCSLMGVTHIIVCINKMDLVSYSESTFQNIEQEFKSFLRKLKINEVTYIPVSALHGEMIVDFSPHMSWYKGPTLIELLEAIPASSNPENEPARFPVQRVIRSMGNTKQDFRGYAGRIESGVFKKGDEIVVFPSGLRTKIKCIFWHESETELAQSSMSVVMTLEDELDLSRGGLISTLNQPPEEKCGFNLLICWFDARPLDPKKKFIVKHTTSEVTAVISAIDFKYNVNTLDQHLGDAFIAMNDIARIQIQTSQPLYLDNYKRSKITGSVILIDPISNDTVASGIIV